MAQQMKASGALPVTIHSHSKLSEQKLKRVAVYIKINYALLFIKKNKIKWPNVM